MYHAAMRSEFARIEFFVSRWQIIPVKIKSREHGLKSLYREMVFSAPVFMDRPSTETSRYTVINRPTMNLSVCRNRNISPFQGKPV